MNKPNLYTTNIHKNLLKGLKNLKNCQKNVKGIILEEINSASTDFLEFNERQILNAKLLEKLIFGKNSYVQRDIYNN